MMEVEGDSSLFTGTASRRRGLFNTSRRQEQPSLDVSDIWNVPGAGSTSGAAERSAPWFANQSSFLGDEQPSPALARLRQGSSVLKRKNDVEKQLKKSMNALDEVLSTPSHVSMSSYTPGSLLKGSFLGRSLQMPSEIEMTPPSLAHVDTPLSHVTPLSHARMDTPLNRTYMGMETPANRTQMSMDLKHLATPKITPVRTPKTSLSILDETDAGREWMMETPMPNQTTFLSFGTRTEESFLDSSKLKISVENKIMEDPIEKTGNELVKGFHGSFSSYHKPGDVLELADALQEVCNNQIEELSQLAEIAQTSVYGQLMMDLNLERSTWQLLHALYRDRMSSQLLEEEDDWEQETMATDLTLTEQSEKKVVDDLFGRDSSVRQAQVVVDWLESNAYSNLKRFPEKIHFFADEVTWENTLHRLKLNDAGHLISEMDPDAPARQGKPLADLDAKDELSLSKHVFACVRAGQLREAQDLCVRCGQPWRAAALEGWRLAHDPNQGKNLLEDDIEPTEGNQTRDLWKLACWEMARDPAYSSHEKAVYAALAGDIKNILPVCSNWFDCVWAYFKVMVDVKAEQKLRTCSPVTGQALESLPTEYWNSIVLPEVIFQEIEANPSEVIREESASHFHLAHKFIILGELDNLIRTIHGWLKDKPNVNQLRFMAHLVLFVRGQATTSEEEKCNMILEAYVLELISHEYFSMVALYTAQLPAELQISCYTTLLRGLSDPEQQRKCLDLGKEAGLDIPVITKSVVEQIRNIGVDTTLEEPALELGVEVELTKLDLKKIEVIKWLVFEESQRAEAIIQGNSLMRQFLACRKLKAAQQVFQKIPTDSMEVVTRNWQNQAGGAPLPLPLTNAIREFYCIRAYLSANDSFNAWFQHFHHKKPDPPPEPVHSDFRGSVEYEQKLKQYQIEEASWITRLNSLSERARKEIYNVLLFVDGGWMVDIPGNESAAESDEYRARQMRLLRETCIPQACFLLLTLFNSMEQYSQSLQLANVIASEEHQLYLLFRQHELEKLLSLVHQSASCMVDDRKNELGYPI